MAKKGTNIRITALYERLSKDDEQQGESNSITNQKKYLETYALQNGFQNIRHFTDDGYTGRNFNRPGFQDLLAEVEAGNVAVVIVKDMSRLGRNYLQVGYYTEVLFPNSDVRFIAVNNSVDSERPSDNDFTPFLNIMNEWYARDTSNKIKSIFEARMREGLRCSGSVPYGYYRLPGDKQTFVVDPIAAEVVQRIYRLADEGYSSADIARMLTADKVLIPSAHSAKYHPEQIRRRKYYSPTEWGSSAVRTILHRQEYLGHTVLRKSKCVSFKTNKRKETPEDEQYIFPNTHEPIISQELWDRVQLKTTRCPRKTPYGTFKHRLSGYLFCSDCGGRLALQTHVKKKSDERYYTFRCSAYGQMRRTCSPHSVNADVVEELLLISLQRISKYVLSDEKAFAKELQERWQAKADAEPDKRTAELNAAQTRYEELVGLIRGLYEHFISGLLPERQYKQLLQQYDSEQAKLEEKIEELQRLLSTEKRAPLQIDRFVALIQRYKNPTEITDDMLREFVDKIVVFETEGSGNNRTKRIEIYFNFIGQFEVAFTPEEIAEAQQKKVEEQIERRRARDRKRLERKRAEKYAQNGGFPTPPKMCPGCGIEFHPRSNRQVYCTKECWKKHYTEEKHAARVAEKDGHTYRQRECVACGSLFWPNSSQDEYCFDCREQHIKEYKAEWYRRSVAAKAESQPTFSAQ